MPFSSLVKGFLFLQTEDNSHFATLSDDDDGGGGGDDGDDEDEDDDDEDADASSFVVFFLSPFSRFSFGRFSLSCKDFLSNTVLSPALLCSRLDRIRH